MDVGRRAHWYAHVRQSDAGCANGVGDEDGFAPALERHVDAIELILAAITGADRSGDDVVPALDPASSGFFENGRYNLLTETRAAVQMACDANWGAMVSHRSGETVDSFIADLTVALGTGHLKTGAPCRGERVEKYNQLMRIEETLGALAVYAGRHAFVR